MEEELWKEKSRFNWLLQGDKNTGFFHTCDKIKRKTNLTTSLVMEGMLESDENKLESHIESYFTKLFNSNFLRQDTGLIHKVIPNLVNNQTNDILTRTHNPNEIQML